jgi:hypothetical protein
VTKPHANAPVKSAEGVVTIVGPVNSALCGVAGPSSNPSATAHLDGETSNALFEALEEWNTYLTTEKIDPGGPRLTLRFVPAEMEKIRSAAGRMMLRAYVRRQIFGGDDAAPRKAPSRRPLADKQAWRTCSASLVSPAFRKTSPSSRETAAPVALPSPRTRRRHPRGWFVSLGHETKAGGFIRPPFVIPWVP